MTNQAQTVAPTEYSLCLRDLSTGRWEWMPLDSPDSLERVEAWTEDIDEVEICDYSCEMLRVYGDRIGNDWDTWCELSQLADESVDTEGRITAYAQFQSDVPGSLDLEEISVYSSIRAYTDQYVEECILPQLPDWVHNYIDYAAYERDIAMDLTYVELSGECYIYNG